MTEPFACAVCNLPKINHAIQYVEVVGWHSWIQPGQELVKWRMLRRRQMKEQWRGCNRRCRRAHTHTLVWGECAFAEKPMEVKLSLSVGNRRLADTPAYSPHTASALKDMVEDVLRRHRRESVLSTRCACGEQVGDSIAAHQAEMVVAEVYPEREE